MGEFACRASEGCDRPTSKRLRGTSAPSQHQAQRTVHLPCAAPPRAHTHTHATRLDKAAEAPLCADEGGSGREYTVDHIISHIVYIACIQAARAPHMQQGILRTTLPSSFECISYHIAHCVHCIHTGGTSTTYAARNTANYSFEFIRMIAPHPSA